MNILFMLTSNVFDFGLTVTIVGFTIVMSALALLSIIFTQMPAIINFKFKRKTSKSADGKISSVKDTTIEGNVTAAISLAMHLYFDDLHDEESNIVTIRQIRKSYSPWSSKIYSVTQNWPKY